MKGGKKKKSNSINNSKVKKNIPLEEKERGRERGGGNGRIYGTCGGVFIGARVIVVEQIVINRYQSGAGKNNSQFVLN